MPRQHTKPCPNCAHLIKSTSARCKPCAMRALWAQSPERKIRQGDIGRAVSAKRRISRPHCVDCGSQISTLGAERCKPCCGKHNAKTNPYFRGEITREHAPRTEVEQANWYAAYQRISGAPDALTPREEQIIVGGLFGDGYLYLQHAHGWASYLETHSDAQAAYLEWKRDELKRLTPGMVVVRRPDRTPMHYMTTRRSPALTHYRHVFYPEGKKIVPDTMLNLLGPLGLAVWFMDDGSLAKKGHMILCTNAWPFEDQVRISQYFFNRWGIQSIPELIAGRYWRLRFRVADTATLYQLIAPHLHEIFLRKWESRKPLSLRGRSVDGSG